MFNWFMHLVQTYVSCRDCWQNQFYINLKLNKCFSKLSKKKYLINKGIKLQVDCSDSSLSLWKIWLFQGKKVFILHDEWTKNEFFLKYFYRLYQWSYLLKINVVHQSIFFLVELTCIISLEFIITSINIKETCHIE